MEGSLAITGGEAMATAPRAKAPDTRALTGAAVIGRVGDMVRTNRATVREQDKDKDRAAKA